MPKFVGAIDVNGAYTLPTADGSANQVLTTNGSGTVSFADAAGGGGSPGGSNTQIQFNNSDSFGGSANFTFDGTSTVTLASTDAGSSAAPIIELYRNSSSAADADYLGQIKFQGENDAGGKVVYAKITAKISDASDTTEDGIIEIAHHKAGSNNISARFTSTALKLINGTGLEVADGLLTLGSTAVTSTAAELNLLDGITAGTVSASLAVVADSNKDVTGFRNIATTGTVTVGNTTGPILSEGTANTLRIDSGDGTIDIGAQNTSATHFYTDTANIIFGTTPSGGSQGIDSVISDTAFYPYVDDYQTLGITSKAWKAVYTKDGADTAPAYTFGGDTDTGMYLYGANQLGFTVGGDSIAYFKEGAGSGYGGLIINDTSETIADGGIRIGQWYTSTYSGIFMDGHTGNEYMMISSGASTFVSCGAGGSVYIRGAENNSTTQIEIDAGNDDIIIGTSGTKTKFEGFIEVLNEIQAGSGSVSDPPYTFDSDGDTGIYHTNNVLRFTTGGSQRGLFSSSGLYAIKASGYGTTAVWSSSTGYLLAYASSIRFKENVVDMPESEWQKIYQLAPRSFDWKTDGTVEVPVTGAADFGFIAEEVNEILPEVVTWSRESNAEDDDELGLGNESELQIQAIAYEKLTTYLVAAVKDQKEKIEAMEARLAALEG